MFAFDTGFDSQLEFDSEFGFALAFEFDLSLCLI